MAFEAINQEDEQKQQSGFGTQGTQTTNMTTQAENVPTLGGQESNMVQGVSAQQSQQQTGGQTNTQTGQKSSGMGARLSNLRKYVNANQNSGMAQKIQTGIEGIRTGLQGNIGTAQTKLQGQTAAEKARIASGQKLVQGSGEGGYGVLEKGRSEAYTQDITPQAPQQQVAATGTDGQVAAVAQPLPDFSQYGQTATDRLSAFNKFRTGEASQYDIENLTDLQLQAKELQKRADLSQSEAGRYQLLRETFNRPAYTTGQQRLDQLILQARPEESRTLQEMTKTIAQPAQKQLSELQAMRESENQLIKQQAQALASTIGTGLGTEKSGFESDIQKRIADEQARAAKQYEQARQIMSAGGDINADVLKAAGVTNESQIKDFLDYYKRGQGQTLQQKVQAGGSLGDQDLQMLQSAVAPNFSFEDFKKAYNQNTDNFQSIVQNAIKDASGGFLDYRSQGPAVGVSQYLSAYDPNRITAATVANAQDLARYQALQALAAEQGGLLQSGMQFGEGAGRIGTFDIGAALGALREYYNPAQTDQYARVSAPNVDQSGLNLINTTENILKTPGEMVTAGAHSLAAPLEQQTGGQVVSAAINAPNEMVLNPLLTTTMDVPRQVVGGTEDIIGGAYNLDPERVLEGSIKGGIGLGTQVPTSLLSGVIKGTTSVTNQATEGIKDITGRITPDFAQPAMSLPIEGVQQATNLGSKYLTDYLDTANRVAKGDIKTLTNPETLKALSGLNLATDTGKLVVDSVNQGLEAAKSVWNAGKSVVNKVFCFLPDSKFKMKDCTEKNIQDVMPGEIGFGTGKILVVGKALSNDLYEINGVKVAGGHAIFEDQSWIRVRDSKNAKKLDFNGKDMLVYNMITETHLMVVGNCIFTDFFEFDGADEISPELAISELNQDKEFVLKVQGELNEQINSKVI